MKTLRFFLFFVVLFFATISCEVDDEGNVQVDEVEVPDQFTVDIPEVLSTAQDGTLSGRMEGDGDGVIEGNEIYEAVRFFIYVGEQSAEIIEYILTVGATLEVLGVNSYTFTSDEDGREKRIDINRDVTRGGTAYAYELVMVDVADDAEAIQLLWNTSPVEGVGILDFYNTDRTENPTNTGAIMKIEYSENSSEYEATMMVSIAGLPVVDDGDVDNMQLFAGRNGDIVEVRGNSNHPEIIILDEDFTGGRNYAFVGRGDEANDIAVVELALPPSSVTTSDVLTDYSVFSVLEEEIESQGITDQDIIDDILAEANAPAYFNVGEGFIGSGDSVPDGFSDDFVDLSALSPFVPQEVRDLEIDFID